MPWVFGVDIGGTRTKAGLVDTDAGVVLAKAVFPSEKNDAFLFFKNLQRNFHALCEQANVPSAQVTSVGVSASGYVHPQDGTVDSISCSFLPFLAGLPLREEVERAFQKPCKVNNDAKVICLGECRYGAGRGYERVLMLTLGTGVGIDFAVRGASPGDPAYLHRAGHVKVTEEKTTCYCGIEGCFESVCSATALERKSAKFFQKVIQCEGIFQLAREKDERARALVHEYIALLLKGLNQYVYLYAPDVVILGGGLALGLGPYREQLQKGITAKVYANYHCGLALAQLGDDGGILGSAALFK